MRLIDLQQHFNNNNVWHAFRRPGLLHDVYLNKSNGRTFTIPIGEEEVPDEYATWACLWLGIEGVDGSPHSAPELLPQPEFPTA